MNRQRNDLLRTLKGILNSVSVMKIKVKVENPLEAFLKERQYGKDNVVCVAESRCYQKKG